MILLPLLLRQRSSLLLRQQREQLTKKFNFSSFCWTGPRSLNEILKKELLVGKTSNEISNIWKQYHDEKESILGMVYNGRDGQIIARRGEESPFMIHPTFRSSNFKETNNTSADESGGDGYFMLVSQYQKEPQPNFMLAYLEDYKTDPSRASPLLTCTIFNDLSGISEDKNESDLDLSLIRVENLNKGISDKEAMKVITNMLTLYHDDSSYQTTAYVFNHRPKDFDLDDYISQQNQHWKTKK